MNPVYNSHEEMGKRFLYLVMYLMVISSIFTGVIAILGTSLTSLLLTLLLGGASHWLKLYGEKHLDFQRLSESFLSETLEDKIPDATRKEIEGLLIEFDTANKDWPKRILVRRRLQEITQSNSLILSAYKKDILRVCPMIGVERNDFE